MDKGEIKSIFDELVNFKIINISQIPDIDLYMDQVTTFVEDRLGVYRRNEADKLLTKTMINNYAKEGLIAPPVKKKYTREQIIRLIMIYHLKTTLSIADIGTLLKAVPQDKTLAVYDGFVKLQEQERIRGSKEMSPDFENIITDADTDKESVVMAVLMLILEANSRKQLAEKLIDRYLKENDNG